MDMQWTIIKVGHKWIIRAKFGKTPVSRLGDVLTNSWRRTTDDWHPTITIHEAHHEQMAQELKKTLENCQKSQNLCYIFKKTNRKYRQQYIKKFGIEILQKIFTVW